MDKYVFDSSNGLWYEPMVKEYADRQSVTEQLKADKPLEWGTE